ncbi:hypothetical protein BSLG_005977 [Batrachochytrium salamandrivorans]|nr:hypothetical protein BSLG_005977 [Batrachochytrium salamandrivorans]
MLRSSSSSSCSSQVNLGVASQSVSNSLGNTSSNHISDEPQPSLIHDPADGSNTMRLNDEYNQANSKTSFIADKRKSRLGTSTYLSKRLSLQEDEKLKVQIAGPLLWNFPASERSGKKIMSMNTAAVILHFHLDNKFENLAPLLSAYKMFEECSKPISTISIANAMSSIVDAPSHPNHWLLRLILVEDNETHISKATINRYYFNGRKSVISRVALRWGAIQKITLEHDVAHLRKQLGSLWEMCQNGVVPPKVQKRSYRYMKLEMGLRLENAMEWDFLLKVVTTMQKWTNHVDAIHSTYNDDDKPLENITEPTQPVVDTCSAKHSIDVKSKISETMLDNTTPIVQHESTKSSLHKIVREGLSRSPTRVDGSTSKQSPTTSDKIDMAFADLIDKKLAQLESESEQDIYLKSTFQKTATADSEPLANTADLVEFHNDDAIPAQSHDNQAKFESAETSAVTVLKHVETVAEDTTQRNALTEFNDDITKSYHAHTFH